MKINVGLHRCRVRQGLLYLSLSEKNAGGKLIDRTFSLETITSLSSSTQTFNLKEKFTMIVINDKYIYTFFHFTGFTFEMWFQEGVVKDIFEQLLHLYTRDVWD